MMNEITNFQFQTWSTLHLERIFGFKPYSLIIASILGFSGGILLVLNERVYWWLGLLAIFVSIGLAYLAKKIWGLR